VWVVGAFSLLKPAIRTNIFFPLYPFHQAALTNVTRAAKRSSVAKLNATLRSVATATSSKAGAEEAVEEAALASAGAVQSAAQSVAAAVRLAKAYVTGVRGNAGLDVKNATVATELAEYTAGRLAFESALKSGSATTVLSSAQTPLAIAASNITCYVDSTTGVVTNIRQGASAACTVGGDQVVVPTAGKYVTKMQMAIDKEAPFIGRLVFHVRNTLDAVPKVYTCGWAGGAAVSLFPKGNVAWHVDFGCQPVSHTAYVAAGRRRSLLQAATPAYALNPGLVNPTVVPMSALETGESGLLKLKNKTALFDPASAGANDAKLPLGVVPTGIVSAPPIVTHAQSPFANLVEDEVANDGYACADGSCSYPLFTNPPPGPPIPRFPPGAPAMGAPTSPSTGVLVVPVTPPAYLGSPAITEVTVTCVAAAVANPSCLSSGPGVFTQTVPLTASPLQATLTVLPGDYYRCFASAYNGVGTPQCSGGSSPVPVSGPPSAATIGQVTSPTAGSLIVPFSAPISPGLPPASSYVAKCIDANTIPNPTCASTGSSPAVITQSVSANASPLQASFSNLGAGASYVCFVVVSWWVGLLKLKKIG
jgi:hypothetical protein